MQTIIRACKRESRITANANKVRKRKRIRRKSQKFTTATKLAKRKASRERRRQTRKAVRMNEHCRRIARAKKAKERRLRKRRISRPQKQKRATMTLVKACDMESARRKKEAYTKNRIERKVKKLLAIAKRNNQDADTLIVSLLCKRKRGISHEMYEIMREAIIFAFNTTRGEGATKLIALILFRANIHDFPLSDIYGIHQQREPLRLAT